MFPEQRKKTSRQVRTAAPALSAALPAPPVESSEEDEEIPDESRLPLQGLGPNLMAWDCSGIVIYRGLGVEYWRLQYMLD